MKNFKRLLVLLATSVMLLNFFSCQNPPYPIYIIDNVVKEGEELKDKEYELDEGAGLIDSFFDSESRLLSSSDKKKLKLYLKTKFLKYKTSSLNLVRKLERLGFKSEDAIKVATWLDGVISGTVEFRNENTIYLIIKP